MKFLPFAIIPILVLGCQESNTYDKSDTYTSDSTVITTVVADTLVTEPNLQPATTIVTGPSPEEMERQQEYERFANNSLATGSTPYSRYYGGNKSCDNAGCSRIRVLTSNSDVLVTIKRNEKVVRHAYIRSGDDYTFEMPNGEYQAFFYYGRGWNPNKEMTLSGGRIIKGGFLQNEEVGKDEPQWLSDSQLTYELILQQDGNFSTRQSSVAEAL